MAQQLATALCTSSCSIAAGETSIQLAHEKRFQDRVQQLFNHFKKQRLTSAAFECEKLVNSAKDKLIEVCLLLCFSSSDWLYPMHLEFAILPEDLDHTAKVCVCCIAHTAVYFWVVWNYTRECRCRVAIAFAVCTTIQQYGIR